MYCPSTIAGNRTHQHQLITPFHYTDELDWPQSIALMKCHLLKSHPLSKAPWWCWARLLLLGHAKALNSPCASVGDAGATAWLAPRRGQAEHRRTGRASPDRQSIAGRAEHHQTGRASLDGQSIATPPPRCCKRANFGCAPFSKCNYVKVTEEEMKLGVVIRKEK